MPNIKNHRKPAYNRCDWCGRNEHKIAVRYPSGNVAGYCPSCFPSVCERSTDFEILYDRRSLRAVTITNKSRKGTWDMTSEELAKVVAEHRGYLAGVGGWIYTHEGLPVVQGYSALAERLERQGIIIPGKGVAWAKEN